jgi:choline dehydrogenase-like flavoprotein
MNEGYDYIVIGSGAGGSAAAYRLANAGKRVLLIEKGNALPLDGSTLDIDKVIRQGLFKNKEPWLDKDGQHFVPEEYFNLGGKTMWYGAALLRYAPHEFEADPSFQCLPWPISYRDLARFYDEAETLLGVSQFDIEPHLQRIVKRVQRRHPDWQIEPLPLGLAQEILHYPAEAKHFDGFASVKGLKSDAQRTLLDRVKHRDNLTILTGHAVRGLQGAYQAPQRIVGVVLDDGRRFKSRTVLLAAGAMHSPRLLQRYMDSSGLAKDLANYALVGRYYKRHLLTAMLAVSPSTKTDLIRKTAVFLNDTLPHSSVQPLGFDGELIARLLPTFVPPVFARAFGQRAYGFFLQTEEGSHAENRIVAEVNGNGAHTPKSPPRLDYDATRLPVAVAEHRKLVRTFRRALLGAGCMSFTQPIPLAGTAHACGTLVTGTDSHASVVNEYGQVHGMENLYVVDGSVLPRVSRVNPSLTIYAWALRVANYLADRGETYENNIAKTDTVRA